VQVVKRANQAARQVGALAALLLGAATFAVFAQNASPTSNAGLPQNSTVPEAKSTAKSAPIVVSAPPMRPAALALANVGKPDPTAKPPLAKPAPVTKPEWAELTPAQQIALKPLGANWASLTETHKRKWISLAQNYPKMPAADQGKLQARMTEWAALSPKQRQEARLNFAQTQELTKALSPEERKAKWQAYQALSPEEKQKLATSAPPKPAGAAVAAKPVPQQKMSSTPIGQDANPNAPRINVPPHLLGQNSLMPLQGNPKP
jgi:Protein of unknown function (DUF3106)